ncbi:MAG: hypothetical protein WBP45_02880 [Daejeonella sp.]
MLKTTKRYVITTNGINAFGFRVLSEGIDLSLYENNPLMLWMHFRAVGHKKDEVLPLGNVKEIQVDSNGVMTGRLYFDDKDKFAVSIYEKYENGTLNMLSLGTQPIDVSDNPDNLLPGQSGPTVMKSVLKEISCVDIGANPEAYAVALYDANDKLITLSDDSIRALILTKQKTEMKLIHLSAPAILALLKLPAETATEAEATAAIQNLVTLADQQNAKIESLKAEKKTADETAAGLQTKLDEQVKLANTAKIETLVQGAVDARKITAGQKAEFVKLAEGNFESVEKLLNGMAGAATVQATLAAGGSVTDAQKEELVTLTKLSFNELFNSGKLEKLKAADPETYKAKYKEKFGKEPVN